MKACQIEMKRNQEQHFHQKHLYINVSWLTGYLTCFKDKRGFLKIYICYHRSWPNCA